MSDKDYQQPFFTVPNRIINLPGLTLQLLKFYEKIFHFWHRDQICFIGNDALMKHCGMKSESTLSKAFQFFEKAGEIKRETIDGRRYIVQPSRKIETDQKSIKKLSTPPSPQRGLPPRHSETPPLATARHNNNNKSNKNNLNKRAIRSPNLHTIPDNFFPDERRRKLLEEHARRTNNPDHELLKKFEAVSRKYKTKSCDWQLSFEEFLIRELPKRTYEDNKGQRRRYDNKSINY